MSGSGKPILLGTVFGFIAGAIGSVLLISVIGMCIWMRPSVVANWLANNQTNITEATTDTFTPASTDEAAVVATVKSAQPAVVSIVASADVPTFEQYYEQDPSSGFGMMDPFGGLMQPQYRQNGTKKQDISSGSGFIVSVDGYIVTNKHVVDTDGASYAVFLNDGTKYDATVVAKDPTNDIAIIKIDATDLPYLTFDDSDDVQVGQTAIAIGNALGQFNNTVSVGVISGLARSIEAGDGMGQSEELNDVLQTDAAINEGNSGGPLLNLSGKVVGVNVAMSVNAQSIGFALPANVVKAVVEMVKTNGKIVRPYLGVRYRPVTAAMQEKNNLSVDYGALVAASSADELAVIPGSPADKAGIQANDIILEVDGKKIDDSSSLSGIIGQKQVGDVVHIKLLHQGSDKEVDVTLEERPDLTTTKQ